MTRQIKLGAFLPGGGQHIAAWRHPDSPADGATSFEFHRRLAETAERGLFDAYFLADGLAIAFGGGIEGGNAKVAGFEPVTLFSALAPLTENLGFIATASTTYDEPYNIARKFASLDLISGGRAGWNVVTTATEAAAHNFNLDQQHPHAVRYARAREHVEVVKKLWDSFEDDAFLRDKDGGRLLRHREGPLHRPPRRALQGEGAAQRLALAAGPSGHRAGGPVGRRARPRRGDG